MGGNLGHHRVKITLENMLDARCSCSYSTLFLNDSVVQTSCDKNIVVKFRCITELVFLTLLFLRAILQGLHENSVLSDVEVNISNNEVSSTLFPSCSKLLFQSEAKCEAIDMKMIFYSYANETHFHKKGFTLGLVVKVRVFGTRI